MTPAMWNPFRVAVGLLLALSLLNFQSSIMAVREAGFTDFFLFLRHASDFLRTGHLYSHVDDLSAYGPGASIYKYPPLYALLLLPFAKHGAGPGIYAQHWLLQIVVYLGTAALGIYAFKPRESGWFVVCAAIVSLNFAPFFETLTGLQIETPVLLLLVFCVLFLQRGRDLPAGVTLGISGMLKVYPAFLLVYFVLRQRWLLVAASVATAGLIGIVGLLVFEIRENQFYFLDLLPHLMGETPDTSTENLGIGRYAYMLFGVGPATAKWIGQFVALPLILASALAVRRNRSASVCGRAEILGFVLFIPLMLLWIPNSWANYQLLLLLPIFALLGESFGGARCRLAILVPTLVASALLCFTENRPILLGLLVVPPSLHELLVDLRIFSTLIVWATLLPLVSNARRKLATESGAPRGLTP